ncbi:protein GstA [Ditylenchus destructor]|nr:protein GstA [Ditylenchus destructor]
MLSLLGIPYQWVDVDILKGDTQTAEFLAKNPNGKIPCWNWKTALACGSPTRSSTSWPMAVSFCRPSRACAPKCCSGSSSSSTAMSRTLRWARFIQFYLGLPQERLEEYKKLHKGGYKALKVMERQLQLTPYLVGDQFSIADVALYAYTHVAHQGGFDLDAYPGVQAWMARVASHPKYVPMLD